MRSIKIRKSTIIGVLILYFILMDSYFPFGNNSVMTVFYWAKFIVSAFIIAYSFLFRKNRDNVPKNVLNNTQKYLLLPWILMLLYSVIIWGMNHTATPYITRGLSNFLSNVIPILLGVALVKLYGERIIKLSIISICLMALTNYIMGIFVNGPSFIVQLFNIFCEETSYRTYKELHEIAYISGLFLIYYVQHKNYKINKIWIFLTICCFFFSWKRIGILALAIALSFYWLLKRFDRKSEKGAIYTSGIVAFFFSIVYVFLSASEGLALILSRYGINMMGRDVLYSYFRRFGNFSLGFMGNGLGFVSRQFTYLTWADVGEMSVLNQGLHNDLFSIYLEIGMIGFIIWLLYWFLYLPQKVNRVYGTQSAFFSFALIIFTFVTYTTDNTLRYFVFQLNFTILLLLCFNEGFRNRNYLQMSMR